jgi:hypothetical protein
MNVGINIINTGNNPGALHQMNRAGGVS